MDKKGGCVVGVITYLADMTSDYSGVLAGLSMFFVALITTFEVLMRHVFDSPTTWVFSVSLIIMVWFALLGAPVGLKSGRQINVDFLLLQFSDRTRAALNVVNLMISIFFVFLLGFYGLWMCVHAYKMGMTSTDLLLYPLWIIYLAFPITGALIALQLVGLLCKEVVFVRGLDAPRVVRLYDDYRVVIPVYLAVVSAGLFLIKVVPVGGIVLVVLCLIFAGVPVSFALGFTGAVSTALLFRGIASFEMVPVIVERTLNTFVLLAIPMFIMGGVLLYKSGVGERTYDLASKLMSGLPGGLAVGTIIASAIFSAMVGVSTAVAAAIGITAIPMLLSKGYTKELTYGCVAGGALGILIPPSAGLIVYGFLTNCSVGLLFAAAFLPALIIVAMYIIYTIAYCMLTGKYEKVSVTWGERLISFKRAAVGLSAPFIMLGGIYTGIFTPTEAAGILVTYSLVVALFYKKMNFKAFFEVIRESAMLASVMLMVMVGAMIFADVIGHLRIARLIAEWIVVSGIPTWAAKGGLLILYIVLGMFLDGLSMTVLTIPVLFPLMPHLGLDVVVFGVILMIFVETALLTPPVGLNLFMIKAMTQDSIVPIIKGNIPFVIILLIGAIILFMFPQVALWLPSVMGIS
jgi:C4-dicarboxylate transporter DctM subunit